MKAVSPESHLEPAGVEGAPVRLLVIRKDPLQPDKQANCFALIYFFRTPPRLPSPWAIANVFVRYMTGKPCNQGGSPILPFVQAGSDVVD